MVSVFMAGVGALSIVAATLFEELTHAIAARPWAVSQRVDLRRMHVLHELPADRSQRVDQWISLAPMFLGIVALALVVVGRGVPPLTDETVLLWVAWAWFTVPSLHDLRAAAGVDGGGEPMTTDDPRMHAVWVGGTIQSIGMLVLLAVDELTPILAPYVPVIRPVVLFLYLRRLGIYLSLAGCAWIFIRLELRRRGVDENS